jgi:hypothetical protein
MPRCWIPRGKRAKKSDAKIRDSGVGEHSGFLIMGRRGHNSLAWSRAAERMREGLVRSDNVLSLLCARQRV